MTFKSSASKKSSRKKDTEERFNKLLNTKLHDVSYFKGEPPEESLLLDIIKDRMTRK